MVKRYMAGFERVSIVLSEGLLEPMVVYRLYRARCKKIVNISQIRQILFDERQAADWKDFIELWNRLDRLELEEVGSNPCPGFKPPMIPSSAAARQVEATKEARGRSQDSRDR